MEETAIVDGEDGTEEIVIDDEMKVVIEEMQAKFKKKMQKEVCVNALVELKENSLEFNLGGCGNGKLNGSKYCQDCSDKYNAGR